MDDDNEQLTAAEQAALDAQRTAPEPAPQPEAPVQEAPEAPQEGATEPEETPAAPEQPETDKRPQMVPHAALHEERERRKAAEARTAEIERRAEERFKALLEKLGPQPTPPAQTPTLPDPQQDPAGFIVARMEQLGASQEQINQELARHRQQQEQQQAVAAVQQRSVALETEFRRETPDYDQALGYLQQFRDRQLAAAGWADPARRYQQIMQEAFGIASQALQEGANPAERLYRLSEASGYAKKLLPSEINDAARTPDPAKQIQTIAKGQEHARSIGSVRGSGPSPMTAQKLLEMSDEDFDKVKDSPQVRALMGA